MKSILMALTTATLAACAALPEQAPAPAPHRGSGLDLAGFDRAVRPQDDLFRFVNGKWLDVTEIPADRSNYGSFTMLDDQAQEDLRTIVTEAAALPARAPGSAAQKIGDFYQSFMDTEHIDHVGLEPLKAEFARIDAISSARDIASYAGYSQRIGVSQPAWCFVAQNEKNTRAYIPYVNQRGLTLPDRDYYLNDDAKSVATREKLHAYVVQLLELAGFADSDAVAGRLIALETRFAHAHWTRVQSRDAIATYNRYTIGEANALTPGFDWSAFMGGAGLETSELVLSQPSFFKDLGAAVGEVPLEDWRLYFKFRLLDAYAPYLSQPFVDLHFDLHGRTLKGIKENRPRWKRALEAMDDSMGELVGQLYVEKYFTPEAKQRIDELVRNVLQAFAVSIDELEWMGPATKAEAHAKLGKITVKIGYPEKWKDYASLSVAPDDLVGNMLRAARLENERNAHKLGRPVDRTEWLMTPQTVNAYYYPPMNEIVFPAAILHPPFFDFAADDAANYGGIGAVIGHEISHAFDDQGRKYDGDGNLRDWWTDEDAQRFKQRAAKLVAQYAACNPLADLHVNGELTLGENIGDLSGLAVAFKAYQIALGGKPSPLIDGFTGEQRFFMGWSQGWRRKYRDEEMRVRLVTDTHSPSEYRTNVVVSNMDEFYRAFHLEKSDKLYRKPSERVEIW